MGHRGFNRQWAAFADQPREQHRGRRGGPWDWAAGPGWAGPGRQGPPPWVAGLFGLQQPEKQRGPRVRRGDVRSAILSVVAASPEPINGYQVMQEIGERSGGEWKPSPGSVYPTLQQLQDEGLVTTAEDGKGLVLTAEGTAYVEESRAQLDAVWVPFDREPRGGREGGEDGSGFTARSAEIGQVMSAVWQIVSSGSEAQQQAALGVLADTRRKLYGILADGEPVDPVDPADGSPETDEADELDEPGSPYDPP